MRAFTKTINDLKKLEEKYDKQKDKQYALDCAYKRHSLLLMKEIFKSNKDSIKKTKSLIYELLYAEKEENKDEKSLRS